jgi:hypothetical protein
MYIGGLLFGIDKQRFISAQSRSIHMGIRAGTNFPLRFHLSGIDGVKIQQLCNNNVSHIILHRATAPDNPLREHIQSQGPYNYIPVVS